jgi:hypothetical protein
MTHLELVTEPREFHLHETRLFSLFLKTLSRHQKHLYNILLNSDETPIETSFYTLKLD